MTLSLQYTLILIFYFAGILFLGFWFNRRVRSDKDYFLAKGKLGPATIGFSFSATQMSGSTYMGAVGTEKILGYNFTPAAVSHCPFYNCGSGYILSVEQLNKSLVEWLVFVTVTLMSCNSAARAWTWVARGRALVY